MNILNTAKQGIEEVLGRNSRNQFLLQNAGGRRTRRNRKTRKKHKTRKNQRVRKSKRKRRSKFKLKSNDKYSLKNLLDINEKSPYLGIISVSNQFNSSIFSYNSPWGDPKVLLLYF